MSGEISPPTDEPVIGGSSEGISDEDNTTASEASQRSEQQGLSWRQKLGRVLGVGAAATGVVVAGQHGLLNEAESFGPGPNHIEVKEVKPSKYEGKPIINGEVLLEDGSKIKVSGSYIDTLSEEVKPQHYTIKAVQDEGEENSKPVLAYEDPNTSSKPTPMQLAENSLGRPVWGNKYGENGIGVQRIGDEEVGSYFAIETDGEKGEKITRFIPAENLRVTSEKPVIKITVE